ncbi:MAG: zf-HC2 domain-containing protein [Acidobacteria bacterium]|nr:zf-HC2 domain-containing protein [Acidobacteriota bacterium]
MQGPLQDGMPCTEFEALLADAVDGALSDPRKNQFRAHAQACAKCGSLFAEVLTGRNWLKSLEEAEPPTLMVRNILLATTGTVSETMAAESWGSRIRRWTELLGMPSLRMVFQPRFAMSFGMAFFSVSLLLNVVGVDLRDVRLADLRPSNLQRSALEQYYETTARVEKYYDNMKLVQDLQARMREIRNATSDAAQPAPENQSPQEPQPAPKEGNPDTTGTPQPKEPRYSQDGLPAVLARVERGPIHPNPEGSENQA